MLLRRGCILSLPDLGVTASSQHSRLTVTTVRFTVNNDCLRLKRQKHTVSKLYQPKELIPHTELHKVSKVDENTSRSTRLFKEFGLMKSVSHGYFALLPLATRSLNKLIRLIDDELEQVGCQKMMLPHIASSQLWSKTGRWHNMGAELVRFKDRHEKDMLLCPTHEETITNLISVNELSVKELPLRLYQVGAKFRAEMKPRFGLIRANEFIMKDLYTFDKDMASAVKTYDEISEAYLNIFNRLGVPYQRVEGDTGLIGGSSSHEFHYPAGIGQDALLWCSSCKSGKNSELTDDVNVSKTCSSCGGEMTETKGIEVGHTFLLGQKYSKIFRANFLGEKGKPEILEMGCYGIGVSRVLAAATEVLSSETELRWPDLLAPYSVCIIPPKSGSKEHVTGCSLVEELCEKLKLNFPKDIIVDDREKMTIGKKLHESNKTGYPIIIVIGKKIMSDPPLLEVRLTREDKTMEMSPLEAVQYLQSISPRFYI